MKVINKCYRECNKSIKIIYVLSDHSISKNYYISLCIVHNDKYKIITLYNNMIVDTWRFPQGTSITINNVYLH